MRLHHAARRYIRRAFFFAAFALACSSAAAQSRGDPARGAGKAAACAACHGPEGRAPLPGMPALAGHQRAFLETQLVLLREGLRNVPGMEGMLRTFNDHDLTDIAAYYSAAKPYTETGTRDAQKYAAGAAQSRARACGSCHLPDYSGQRGIPRIANQREDYLINTLKEYRDDKRVGSDTNMNGLMYGVSDAEIAALAHYLAHQ